MNINVAEIIHRQIVVDLTIRTLERERKHLNNLKMKNAFALWIDKTNKELKENLRNIKNQLNRQGVKIQSEVVEGDFTLYTIIDKGRAYERKYNNIALRNWCEEEVKRVLGLEYRTTADGMKPPGKLPGFLDGKNL